MSTLAQATARDALGWARITIGALCVLIILLAWDSWHERRQTRKRSKAMDEEIAELLDRAQ